MTNLQAMFKPTGAAYAVPKTARQRHKRGEVWHKLDNGDVVSGTFLIHRGMLKVEVEGARRVEPVGDNDPLQSAERLLLEIVEIRKRGGAYRFSSAQIDAALIEVLRRPF